VTALTAVLGGDLELLIERLRSLHHTSAVMSLVIERWGRRRPSGREYSTEECVASRTQRGARAQRGRCREARPRTSGAPGKAVPPDMAAAWKLQQRASPAAPALRSSAALVLDATHSSVLYSRHSDVAVPIASITKLMTALVVMEAAQPLDEQLEVTAEDGRQRSHVVSRLATEPRSHAVNCCTWH